MSVAVAVGFIALAGVAAETGVIMLIYLDNAMKELPGGAGGGRQGVYVWERNLRFMADSSKDGPEGDAPAVMPAGMLGDSRGGDLLFARGDREFIDSKC
jgi:hypothetical protein